MHQYIKRIFNENLKSSPKFGRSSDDSKNFFELFRERRFLYFTKNGPIEIVFNIKHYISAFVLSLVFIFKIIQFIFFGVSSFFNYMTFKNNQVINQKFTDSEIETLKNIANEVIKSETSENVDNKNKLAKTNELTNKNNIQESGKIDIKEKLDNIKILFSNFGKSFTNEINRSDEVIFDQFSGLASPEMVAFDHVSESIEKKEISGNFKKESFSYKDLPVIPFTAPRTKKLKIINGNHTIEIMLECKILLTDANVVSWENDLDGKASKARRLGNLLNEQTVESVAASTEDVRNELWVIMDENKAEGRELDPTSDQKRDFLDAYPFINEYQYGQFVARHPETDTYTKCKKTYTNAELKVIREGYRSQLKYDDYAVLFPHLISTWKQVPIAEMFRQMRDEGKKKCLVPYYCNTKVQRDELIQGDIVKKMKTEYSTLSSYWGVEIEIDFLKYQ